jgi:hypothetical protein
MGQAKVRKEEIAILKQAGNQGQNFAINFKFHLRDEEDYRYNLLAVYTPNIIAQMKSNDYDNDKCFDIIGKCSRNILVCKAGNADMSNSKVKNAVQECLRSVALAVLRMAILDPYKEVGIRPDMVLDMTLSEVDGNIGFNLIEGQPDSMFEVQKGVQTFINKAQSLGIDFVVTVA